MPPLRSPLHAPSPLRSAASRVSRGALPVLALAIAGCGAGIPVTRKAPEAVRVAGESVVVAGPPGYCIDSAASGERAAGAFVLLGSCASLSRDASLPHPSEPGVLTVTVSPGEIGPGTVSPLLSELEAFFRTDPGRAALSRDGRAASVAILETRIEDGALFLHARDASSPRRGIAEDYWRALFGVNRRLVTLSVNGFSAAPLSDRAGLSTLDAFAARIRAANGAGAAS